MFTDIKTRSYGLGKILSAGWKVYREKFRVIFPVILIIYIPVNIILLFVPGDSYGMLEFRIATLLEFFVGIIAIMAIAKIVECSIEEKEITYGQALQYSLSRWGNSIGTEILGGLIVLGMTLLFIVPGIIWGIYYAFSLYVVTLRDIAGKEALDYSKTLVKGQWGRVFVILFVIGLLTGVTALAVGFVVGIPLAFIPNAKIINIITDTGFDLVAALFTVMTIIFFLNTDYYKNINNKVEQQR